jgi:diguanylate cyclase (GGDEF)-like protein
VTNKHPGEVEEWHWLTYANMPLYCSFYNQNLKKIECSHEAVNFFGLKDKQEYMDKFSMLSPEYQPDGSCSKDKAVEMLQLAMKSGRNVFEWMHQDLNGDAIPVEVTLVRVEMRDGSKGIIAYTKDLREMKAAEAKVNEALKRTQILLDATPLCCQLWDENLNMIDCNLEALRLFDFKNKREFIERFPELSPKYQPDLQLSKNKAVEMLKFAFQRGGCVFEWMHQKLNCEPIPTEITLARVELGDGPNVIAGYTRDLRQTKAAELKAKEAYEQSKIMFEAMPLGCTFWDENANLIDCNNEVVRLFELKNKREFLDRFLDLLPERQPDGNLSRDLIPQLILYAIRKEKLVFEWMHKNLKDHLIPTEITLIRVRYSLGYIVLGYIRDLREIKDKISKLNFAEKLAFSDTLTGVYNRRYFNQYAAHEFSTQKITLSYIGIIIFDIDHFKRVNDTYGHDAGDEALKLVSAAAQSALRETDLFARYGGEEFIVLAHLNLYDSAKLAERVCKKIEKIEFMYGTDKIPLTISAGVAIRKKVTQTLEEVIKNADMALYRAKTNGRNRVEVCEE